MSNGRAFLSLSFLVFFQPLCRGQALRSDAHQPTEQEGLQLLRAVCPNDVQTASRLSCKSCPSFTPFQGQDGPFEMRKVVYGNFTGRGSEEAFVGFAGCSPPPAAGGSVLLKKSPAGWRMVQNEPGRYAWECQRYPLRNRRQILICQDGWAWQGFQETEIYTIDFAAPQETWLQQLLHFVADNSVACPETWKKINIIKTELRDMNYDGWRDLSLFVTAGKVKVPEELRKKCEGFPPPEMKLHRLDFLFNGRDFVVAPWAEEVKSLLENF